MKLHNNKGPRRWSSETAGVEWMCLAFPASQVAPLQPEPSQSRSSSFSDLVELAIRLWCSPITKCTDSTPSHWLIYRCDRLLLSRGTQTCVLFPSASTPRLSPFDAHFHHLPCPILMIPTISLRQVCKCPSFDALAPEGQMGFWICECPEDLGTPGYCLDSVATKGSTCIL